MADTGSAVVTNSVDVFVDSWPVNTTVGAGLHSSTALVGRMKGLKQLMAKILGYHQTFV